MNAVAFGGQKRALDLPVVELTVGCEPPNKGLNSDPLYKHYILITGEPSFQPLNIILKILLDLLVQA